MPDRTVHDLVKGTKLADKMDATVPGLLAHALDHVLYHLCDGVLKSDPGGILTLHKAEEGQRSEYVAVQAKLLTLPGKGPGGPLAPWWAKHNTQAGSLELDVRRMLRAAQQALEEAAFREVANQ